LWSTDFLRNNRRRAERPLERIIKEKRYIKGRPIPTEAEVQKAILEYLGYKGYFCWRNNTGAIKTHNRYGKERFFKFGRSGSGDILGLTKDGRFFTIEVKSVGGRIRPFQHDFMEEVRKNKGLVIVAYSLDDVSSVL